MIDSLAAAVALTLMLEPAAASPAPGSEAVILGAEEASEFRSAPLDRVFAYWTDYRALPEEERDLFVLRYAISGPEGWSLWLERTDGAFTQLAAWPAGQVEPPDDEAFARAAELRVDAEDGGAMSVNLRFEPRLETAQTYASADLIGAVVQANRAVRSAAGVAALFAPRMGQVVFQFSTAAPDAWAILDDGSRIALPVEMNRAFFPVRDRRFRRADRIEFGAEPVSVTLEPR